MEEEKKVLEKIARLNAEAMVALSVGAVDVYEEKMAEIRKIKIHELGGGD